MSLFKLFCILSLCSFDALLFQLAFNIIYYISYSTLIYDFSLSNVFLSDSLIYLNLVCIMSLIYILC